jgi:amino acid transporter
MQWLFERTIEIAAWVAMIVAWISAVLAAVWLIRWFGTLNTDPAEPWGNLALLRDSAKAAGSFVAFAAGLGLLACVDRFIFDADKSAR